MEPLVVFTDGSCIGNGKPGARAGYAMMWPYHPDFSGSFRLRGPQQTNNRAEYSAVIQAIETANSLDPTATVPLRIYTDSQLLIHTCTKWISQWKTKGWKTAQKKPVANLDLVLQLDHLLSMAPRQITFHHVRAHTGETDWESRCNQLVDEMARQGALIHS